jgi:hypothetical protein
VRQDVKIEGREAYERIKALARNWDLAKDPKTVAVFLAANVKLLEFAYGKNPDPPGLEEEAKTVESTATVERVQPPSPQHLASVLAVLHRVGRLPDAGGAGGSGGGPDA